MFKVRRGGSEDIPLVQGKEHWMCFAVAAMKRPYIQGKRSPSKTVGVARGHQRADTLKPYSRNLVNLITQTTALSNSVKLSPALWGHPRRAGHDEEV